MKIWNFFWEGLIETLVNPKTFFVAAIFVASLGFYQSVQYVPDTQLEEVAHCHTYLELASSESHGTLRHLTDADCETAVMNREKAFSDAEEREELLRLFEFVTVPLGHIENREVIVSSSYQLLTEIWSGRHTELRFESPGLVYWYYYPDDGYITHKAVFYCPGWKNLVRGTEELLLKECVFISGVSYGLEGIFWNATGEVIPARG